MRGKIIKGIAGFYYVNDGNNQIYQCRAKGIFRNKNIKPLVGDNVEFSILDEEAKEGNIDEIFQRKNQLIRPAVANIDQALVVFAVAEPEPNLNLLDRFLVMMEQQEIPVIICFNKQELKDDSWKVYYEKIYRVARYTTLFISVSNNQGIGHLHQVLNEKTTVLAGPSGVGKSSLTNLLKPDANMQIGSVSEKIKRGKHTTRHSELFLIGENSYMMDTPGFSSMYVEEQKPEELKDCFPEFGEFEGECKFLGCVHIGEHVCGVKAAVEEKKISESRYENYRLFYQELKDKRRY